MYVVWVGRGPYFWQCKGCTQPYMRLKDSAVDRSVFPVAGFRHLQNVSFLSYFICILYPFKQLCEHIAAGIKFTNIQTIEPATIAIQMKPKYKPSTNTNKKSGITQILKNQNPFPGSEIGRAHV